MAEAGWHLVTGEYPPDPGGVADHTALVAAGLAAAGRRVDVWTGGRAGPAAGPVTVHRVAGRFGPAGLVRLAAAVARTRPPRTLLVQYTPHAFGWKAMNLPLCLWLAWRRAAHRDDVRVMFHEVWAPFARRPVRQNVLAAAHRLMAAVLLAGCRRCYVSTPAWGPRLDRLGGRRVPRRWLPVPANVPADPDPAAVAAARRRLTGGDPAAAVVGSFGTFGPLVAPLLAAALAPLLDARPGVRVLLVGRGAGRFRAGFVAGRGWAGRVAAADGLPAAGVAAHLAACDLAVQPYPDGITARRTTAMAWLAAGVPVVTTGGPLTEPFWAADRPVELAADPAAAAARLLDDPAARAALGGRGRAYYARHFAVGHTVTALLADA